MKRALGERTIEEIAALYVTGLTWNQIGHRLSISRPRYRGKDTRFGAMLLFDAAGHPGYVCDLTSNDSAERYAAALGVWLRSIVDQASLVGVRAVGSGGRRWT